MKQTAPETWTDAKTPAQRLLRAYLNHPSPRTVRAYTVDLGTLVSFLGCEDHEAVADTILAIEPHRGNELGDEYIRWLREKAAAPSTIWRKVYSLKSLVRAARRLGFIYWTIDVKPPKPRPLRDTRGPGAAGYARMMAAASSRRDAKGIRDLALLRLLHDLALRAAEALDLTCDHLDLASHPARLAVLGKGEVERAWLDLPMETADALAHWLAIRGPQPGPLWARMNPAGSDEGEASALGYDGLREVVGALARKSGVRCTVHGIRHTAITTALDRTNGNIREVQAFSRHRSAEMVCRYDDARKSHASEVADLVAANPRPTGPERAARKARKRT